MPFMQGNSQGLAIFATFCDFMQAGVDCIPSTCRLGGAPDREVAVCFVCFVSPSQVYLPLAQIQFLHASWVSHTGRCMAQGANTHKLQALIGRKLVQHLHMRRGFPDKCMSVSDSNVAVAQVTT